MNQDVYQKLREHKNRFGGTISWRLKAHSKIVEKHLNPGEEILYSFACQKNYSSFGWFNTFAVALTNKRIILAQKHLLFGYTFLAITPEMFNDITVKTGIIWARLNIDTIKEEVVLSNISKRAVTEIETVITEYMMEEKKKYGLKEKEQ